MTDNQLPPMPVTPPQEMTRRYNAYPRLVEALRDVAIVSLRYCEKKYGHDDQARLNLEALLKELEAA
jgi:hypothetical protein